MARVGACVAACAAMAAAAPAFAQPAPDAQAPAKPAPARPAAKAPAKPTSKDKTVEGVTVTAGQPDVTTAIDRKSYTLGKDLQATTGSIADALRNVPSVDVDLQGNLSLRGDSNVTIMVDGKPAPQFEGSGRADALQQLPADQIERVEVITNPSAALNPEGTGGVINLITKKSRGAGVTGAVYGTVGSAGLKRAGASFGYNSKTLSVTGSIAGNYQRNKQQGHEVRGGLDPITGQVLENHLDSIGRNIARGPSGRLSATWTPDAKDSFTGAYSYNELLIYGHPFNHIADDGPNGQVLDFLNREGHRRFEELDFGLTGGWKHTFGDGHDLSLDLVQNVSRPRDHFVYQTFQSLPATATPFEGTHDAVNQRHPEVRLAYERPMPDSGQLKAGYEWKYDDNVYLHSDGFGATETAITPDPTRAENMTYRQTLNAAYATWQRSFGSLSAQAGVRLEDVRFTLDERVGNEVVDRHYTSVYPTLHLAWALDDERKLTASYSKRVQRVPAFLLNPLIVVVAPKDLQQGNPNLRPEETQSYELGYEQRSGATLFTATLYYRDHQGDFSAVLKDLGDGVFLSTFDNLGSSKNAGLELVANGKLAASLTYNGSMNFVWSEVNGSNIVSGLGSRSAFGVGGRANLNWQADADDLLQLNAFVRTPFLTVQGEFRPNYTVNLGWRRKITDRLTATLTVQDLFETNGFRRVLRTPVLFDDFHAEPVSRAWFLRFDYRFGGGRAQQQQPNFEYEGGGGPPGR